jgi:hypothetical protein
MLQGLPFPMRTECPQGLCDCRRDELLGTPGGDLRILRLTREEEKKLVERIDAVETYEQLKRLGGKLFENLGVRLSIAPSANEVRTTRGINIVLLDQPGLCRKTRQAIPTAIRRCLDRHPEIAYAILDETGLFGPR